MKTPGTSSTELKPAQKFSRTSKVLGGVVCFILLFGSFYTIPSGQVGLESTLGVYQRQHKSPGLYFKFPIFQGVTKVDVKSKIAHYGSETSDKRESRSGVINLPQITVLDEKNLDISMQLSIRYKVNPDNIYDIYINDGGNFFNKRINPIILEETRNVLGKYRADSVSTKKEEISSKIKTALRLAFEKEVFFFIEDVNVRRFSLDPIIKKRIAAVESANQKEKELQYEVKQAEQRKQISIKDAQAKADSILIEATAQAQANNLLSKSLTNNLVRIKEIEKWDGKLPTVSGNTSGMLMSMPINN
jgi:regulator of protease activity HflC (stomatin/prohibitin superfamily)